MSQDRPPPRDPFAEIAALPGVGAAAGYARDAVDALLRHPVLRNGHARVAAESVVRGARASARLAGARSDDLTDPVLQGALRATGEIPSLVPRWAATPAQVLARLHVLAARDVADDSALGRPRDDVDRARLDQLLQLTVSPTRAPAVVVAALVHGELATLGAFGTADSVTARAAERIVLAARGVDPHLVGVPEAGHLAQETAYHARLADYAAATPTGVAGWVRHCCDAYAAGAEEGLAICQASR